ncbi:hypothetical protein [Halolamina salifodinae]|uniref:Uncharacterized protein n=1 Tax=Halolamina salifodinae TaxID=1202767 RepID=A0A8T4GWN1_9EURY|nr:hypothetical protein [Halolamina salifodinae]MBP1986084.1 hypothetical protein [Halolamina salifodinae]
MADIAVEQFLGESFPRSEAKLKVLWRPREGRDVQRVQYADDAVSLGWHKDDDHPEPGETHYQLESDDGVRHEPANIEAEAPLSVLEICLDRLRKRLPDGVND